MAIIKCKMCGGDIMIAADKTFGTCEYCGSTMTLPKVDDDRRAAAFNRGNHFRRIGEFDKALAVYERIVAEDNTDAEAHWCCALCRFGIEYVEDPATYEYLPTCHRASFDSILEDVDYLAAVEYSDGITRRQYQKDAAKIAEVQRGILATSSKEEPFDVFICYKESDAEGNRTHDSLLAQEVYYQLTEQGYRVFFSRITLEDKVGAQYEPYIFAALNSAKVMVAIGTKEEHFNAVWVKNEWSRFLALMKKDRSKLLLPCYRDMDPYDMPEALSVLQSYDMGKIGFIQDLVRGIGKVLHTEPVQMVKETVVVQAQQAASTNIVPLLKRAFMFLEDGEWERADDFCEQVLNIDPECAEAYLGKLMIDLKVATREGLKNCDKPFDGNSNYVKAVRFGDDALRDELKSYLVYIENRNQEAAYKAAIAKMNNATTEDEYKRVVALFEGFGDYKDAKQLVNACGKKAEFARKDAIYNQAKYVMETKGGEASYKEAAGLFGSIDNHRDATALTKECLEKAESARKDAILTEASMYMQEGLIERYNAAIRLLETIPGWKDADERIGICKRAIANLEETAKANAEAARLERERQEEAARLAVVRKANRKKRTKKNIAIVAVLVVIAIVAYYVVIKMAVPKMYYNAALEKYGEETVSAFVNLEVGDIYTFGSYEQDNDLTNGKEEIEWQVIADEGTKILVVSKYVLDLQLYNSKFADVTWETCSLREWMNTDFISTAFSEDEQSLISMVKVSADKNPYYDTAQGGTTNDKIFLLSLDEIHKFFETEEKRVSEPTRYVCRKGLPGDEIWGLRTLGNKSTRVTYVNSSTGDTFVDGRSVSNTMGIRPAMWIDLNA